METKQPKERGAWTPYTIYAMTILTLVYALSYADRNALTVLLPSIKREMQLSDTMLGVLTAGFVISYSIAAIPIARWAERASRRNIIAGGMIVWSAITSATGFCANALQLGIARLALGVGEASAAAPAHSMVSDLFDKARRPMGHAMLTAGVSLGVMLGLPFAGWADQHFSETMGAHWGWRMAYILLGIPGVILALLLFFTVKEPERGAAEAQGADTGRATLGETIAYLLRSPTFVWINLGGALLSIYLAAILTWTGVFLVRVHDLGPAEMGAWIGIIRGPSGLAGVLFGGFLATTLGKKEERWRAWAPALCCVLIAPFELLFLLHHDLGVALAGLAGASFFAGAPQGAIFAISVSVARVRMRTMAAAISLTTGALIGQVIGPIGIGFMNDQLAGRFGDESVRYSMVVAGGVAILAGLFMYIGSKTLRADTERATQGTSS